MAARTTHCPLVSFLLPSAPTQTKPLVEGQGWGAKGRTKSAGFQAAQPPLVQLSPKRAQPEPTSNLCHSDAGLTLPTCTMG